MNRTFNRLMDELKLLHDAKSNDYAKTDNPYSNFTYAAEMAKDFTDPVDKVFATMIGIKLARIAQLSGTGKTSQHESVMDTFNDLTNYAAIWTSYRTDAVMHFESREEAIARKFVSQLQTQQE